MKSTITYADETGFILFEIPNNFQVVWSFSYDLSITNVFQINDVVQMSQIIPDSPHCYSIKVNQVNQVNQAHLKQFMVLVIK